MTPENQKQTLLRRRGELHPGPDRTLARLSGVALEQPGDWRCAEFSQWAVLSLSARAAV